MTSRPVSSTIWVGNLPFDATEAELTQLLSAVGPIKNLRLIIDRDSGRPKGFGFCEYYDKSTAESAHRNLNNQDFHGRPIRIDFAEEQGQKPARERDDRPPPGPSAPPSAGPAPRMIGYAAAAQSAQAFAGMLGGPPCGDRRVQDQLNELLASNSRPELWEVMRLLREFLGTDRAAAKQYFADRPGLTKAVFQAQLLLGMVKPPAAGAPAPGYGQPPPASFQEGPISLGGHMAGGGGPMGLQPPAGAVVQQQQPPPGVQVVVVDPSGQQLIVQQPPQGVLQVQPQGALQLHPQGPPSGMAGLQPMQPMQMAVPQQPPQHELQLLPVQGPPSAQPMQPQQLPLQPQPPQPASGGMAAAFPGQDPAQMQALLRQVVNMTDEQINSLPEQFRQQVLFVKEQIRAGAVRVE